MRWLSLASLLLAGCHLLLSHDLPRDGAPAEKARLEASSSDGGCPAGQELCAGLCVDPMSDPRHCGRCDVACSASECAPGSCEKGSCVGVPKAGPCQGGAGQCVAGGCCTTCVKDGACMATPDDLTSCGAKGGPCADCTQMPGLPCTTRSCVAGSCSQESACAPNQACAKGECCACIALTGACVKTADQASCGVGGGSCEPCAAPECQTSACDAAVGACIPGPKAANGTLCSKGTCAGGACCDKCAQGDQCVNKAVACGPSCSDCTKAISPLPCRVPVCNAGTCEEANATDGAACFDPVNGTCRVAAGQAWSQCCTGCWDKKAGKCLLGSSPTACGTAGADCKDCALAGMVCAAFACQAP